VVPTLARQMAEGSEARVLLVVRLAGEIQSPALVAPLRDLLSDGAPRLAAQAAKALVHIGSSESTRALAEALSNPHIEVAKVAAMCLGALRDPRTLQPLLATLERARAEKQIDLAREIIRTLSQFKQGIEAALPVLTAILQRRTPLWRRAEWQLKLEAVRTLGPQPGAQVLCALEGAARSRNSHLRRRAQQMLAHRARAGIDPAP
jgi:HEAT repeat protein